jgi:hypothetical protein
VIDRFIVNEGLRSWRSFLSSANDENWKHIRKATRFWTLNELSSSKFCRDEAFRNYIGERTSCLSKQLKCFLHDEKFNSNSQSLESIISNAFFICIDGCSLTIFPSSANLRHLFIGPNNNITSLGDFENLEELYLGNSPVLTTVGNLPKLTSLNGVIPSLDVFFQFPLEQLTRLHLQENSAFFHHGRDRLFNLKSLSLASSETDGFAQVINSFRDEALIGNSLVMFLKLPSSYRLEFLQLADFIFIDLAGQNHLKTLIIENTPNQLINGQSDVLPTLKSFTHSCSMFVDRDLINFLPQMVNLSELKLSAHVLFAFDPASTLCNKITSLSLNSAELTDAMKQTISQQNYFEKIAFTNLSLTNLSFLVGSIQKICLSHLKQLTDISPIATIPYVELNTLPNVTNFSCLGIQKYLDISYCPGLAGDALDGFGNILHLKFFFCDHIGLVYNLVNTKIISFTFCSLQYLQLPGDHDFVHIKDCYNLKEIDITGNVYSLSVDNEKKPKIKNLKTNCEYYNDEVVKKPTKKPIEKLPAAGKRQMKTK